MGVLGRFLMRIAHVLDVTKLGKSAFEEA